MSSVLNKKSYFAFSGQGAFKPGFGKQYLGNTTFSSRFNEVIDLSNLDVSEFAFGKSSIQTIKHNSRLQITHFALTWAMAHAVASKMGLPQLVFGHSLGEICALVFSGALSVQDGVALIALRGKLMEECSKDFPQDLLIGFSGDEVLLENLIREKYENQVFVSNLNSGKQTVISGKTDHLKSFATDLSQNHGIKTQLLGVGLAFHSPLMAEADKEFRAAIDRLHIQKPQLRFFSVEACRELTEPEDIRRYLKSHMLGQVHWKSAMVSIKNESRSDQKQSAQIIEIGLVKVLKGLFWTDHPDLEVIHPMECLQ